MKKVRKVLNIIIILFMALVPVFYVDAAITSSSSNVSLYVGETKSITLNSNGGAGRVQISTASNNITITNGGGRQWIDGTLTVSFRGVSAGSSAVIVTIDDFSDKDGNIIEGTTRINVTVSNRPVQTQAPQTQPSPTQPATTRPTTTKANVEVPTTEPTTAAPETTTVAPGAPKLKNLKVVGYEIEFKPNTLEYTIKVSEDVTELYVIADKENEGSNITGAGIVKVKDVDQIAVSVVDPATELRSIYLVNIIHVKSAAKVKKSSSTLNIILLLVALFIAIAIIVVLVLKDQGIIGNKTNEVVDTKPEETTEELVEEKTEEINGKDVQ